MSKIPIYSLCACLFLPFEAQAVSPARCDTVYAVHDANVKHSQFFTYRLKTHRLNSLGKKHRAYNLEGLSIHPDTHVLYASSGNPDAKLYTVDAITGDISVVGEIGFDTVVALAFHPEGSLWGWSQQGLLEIDVATGKGTLILPGNYAIQGLTWDKLGYVLFAVAEDTPEHSTLWAWMYDSDSWFTMCEHLPKKVESLETRPDGLFAYGFHNDEQLSVHAYDITSCETLVNKRIDTPFNDVEGIAWPDFECVLSNTELLRDYLESEGYQNIVIGDDGHISAELEGETHQAQLDSEVFQGSPLSSDQLIVTEIADANNDGFNDFRLTYPSGEQQTMFYFGSDSQQPPVREDVVIRNLWDEMNAALVAGDVQTAISYLTVSAQRKYQPVFEALLPHMSEIVGSYSPLGKVFIIEDMAEFVVYREIKGELKMFFVYYLKGEDGVWRLSAM